MTPQPDLFPPPPATPPAVGTDCPDDEGRWAGWHRPAGSRRWRLCCTRATFGAAWAELLRVKGGDKLVIEVGRDPGRR